VLGDGIEGQGEKWNMASQLSRELSKWLFVIKARGGNRVAHNDKSLSLFFLRVSCKFSFGRNDIRLDSEGQLNISWFLLNQIKFLSLLLHEIQSRCSGTALGLLVNYMLAVSCTKGRWTSREAQLEWHSCLGIQNISAFPFDWLGLDLIHEAIPTNLMTSPVSRSSRLTHDWSRHRDFFYCNKLRMKTWSGCSWIAEIHKTAIKPS
jgi:hypothetical protein